MTFAMNKVSSATLQKLEVFYCSTYRVPLGSAFEKASTSAKTSSFFVSLLEVMLDFAAAKSN